MKFVGFPEFIGMEIVWDIGQFWQRWQTRSKLEAGLVCRFLKA
jgi:hypothetical protein